MAQETQGKEKVEETADEEEKEKEKQQTIGADTFRAP